MKKAYKILLIIALDQFLNLDFLVQRDFHLIILAIAFGFLAFYKDKDIIEKELEDEKDEEERAEKKRFEEFGYKFPRINKIWGLRRFVRWMYKEGWLYSLGLIAMVILGFTLRVWNVGNIDLVNDEYRHMNAMKHFFTDGFFEQPRSQITTWLLIGIKYFVSYDNFFAFKLPFVIIGTISIALMYFLSKYYTNNQKVALLSSYLFAIFPLAIGLARYIREYEIVLFLMLISIIIIKNFDSIIINFLVLLFWVFFYDKIGPTSILILGIISTIFFLSLLKKYISLSTRWKILRDYRINLVLVAMTGILSYISLINYLESLHPINKGFLFLFNFPQISHQFDANPIGYTWFTQLIPFALVIVLISFFLTKFFLKENIDGIFNYLEILGVFFISMIYFLYLGNFQFIWQARYIYYLCPFYILILSIASFQFLKLINRNFSKSLKVISLLLFFIILFSPYNSINNLIIEKNGNPDPFHGQPIYSERDLCSYLLINNIHPSQIVVARSWALDYCLDIDYLNDSEKKKYIYFPEDENYEYYDRGRIFTLVPYTIQNSKIMKERIVEEQMTFLVISSDSLSGKDYSSFLSKIDGLDFELIKKIPEKDVRYKYLIYKITIN